mmetsp:Transcript_1198/g.1676  ORF Transcript_1198/g.1676 Transcript_1198/m.1676 type:complete len:126 (+) Transcript_1198:265-642(+)
MVWQIPEAMKTMVNIVKASRVIFTVRALTCFLARTEKADLVVTDWCRRKIRNIFIDRMTLRKPNSVPVINTSMIGNKERKSMTPLVEMQYLIPLVDTVKLSRKSVRNAANINISKFWYNRAFCSG